MESINFFKGYGKVNPLEDQTFPQRPTAKKHLITVAVSLIILLTVTVGAVVASRAQQSRTGPPQPSSTPSTDPAESIRAVCSVTQHPDSCFASLSSHCGGNPPSETDPERILLLSLRIAADELKNLSSVPKLLISKSNDLRTESALKDCESLFEEALSNLEKTASEMVVGPGEMTLTEAKIGDMVTWISAAMTDQETCLDGLEEMGSTVVDEVRGKVQRSREYMSNSLAILSNIKTVLQKFGLTLH